MTTQIAITNGTEKQNTYATKIYSGWIAKMEQEIAEIGRRIKDAAESVKLSAYKTDLECRLAHLIATAPKLPASHIIGLHAAGHDIAEALIGAARKI